MTKLKKIYMDCKVCQKFQRRASKPKVGLTKARIVNEVVSIDLKQVSSILDDPKDDRQIVYMVDEFSGFTAGGVSKNKQKENVASVILRKWCLTGPGYPKRSFFSDNGGEFSNDLMEELTRKLNIKMELTPA